MFYFVRHGKTDYSERNTKIYQGFGVNLSKLSETGVHQIKETAKDERLQGADLSLALHTQGHYKRPRSCQRN